MGRDYALVLRLLQLRTSAAPPCRLERQIPKLTKREQQVVRLVASGHSNRDIGTELRITERTERVHVERILLKLDPDSRLQLAIWAIRNGEAADVELLSSR